jgi:predicted dinucleotide-utilizing enzyme
MRVATSEEVMLRLGHFIENCILEDRQQRSLGFLSSSKGLNKWTKQLDHFQKYLDVSRAINVAEFTDGSDLIVSLAFPESVDGMVCSTLRGMNAVVMSLKHAVIEAYKCGNGSIIMLHECALTFVALFR